MKRRIHRSLLLLACALLMAGGCKNYGDGEIKGFVRTGPSHYSGIIQGIMDVTVTAFDTFDDSIAATTQTGATSADAGLYSMQLAPGTYRLSFELGNPEAQTGYAPEEYYNVNVPPATSLWLEPVTLISYDDYKNGGLSGTITDAASGEALAGAAVSLRPGLNKTYDTPAASATTNAAGAYSFSNLPAGQYTAQVALSGYVTGYFTVLCEGGEAGGAVITNQNYAVSPIMDSDWLRIVLTWGEAPADLDAILTGPAAPRDTTKRFQVDAMHGLYSYNGLVYAEHETDATGGFGPESIVLYTQVYGTYRFYVYNIDAQFTSPNTELSTSGARVDVYRGGIGIDSFAVPAGQSGNLWKVFEMRGGIITPVNELSQADTWSDLE